VISHQNQDERSFVLKHIIVLFINKTKNEGVP